MRYYKDDIVEIEIQEGAKVWNLLELADLIIPEGDMAFAPLHEQEALKEFREETRTKVQFLKKRGLQPSVIASRTGLDLKTVSKYY